MSERGARHGGAIWSRSAFLALAAAFAVSRFQQGVGTRVWCCPGDSGDYMASARAPLFSRAALVGKRPPLEGWFIRLVGTTPGHVAWAHTAVSVACWLLCAWAFSRHLANRGLRVVGVAAVLFLGTASNVGQWDRVVSTESLGISLAVLLVALLLMLARQRSTGVVIALCAVAVAMALLRDTNGIMLTLAAAMLGLWAWRSGERVLWTVAAAFLLAGLLGSIGASMGRRFDEPLQNLVTMRLATDTDAREFLQARGLRLSPDTWNRIAGQCVAPRPATGCVTLDDPAFYRWLRVDGRRAYASWLVHHPFAAIADPIRHATENIDTYLRADFVVGIDAPAARLAETWMMPKNPRLLWWGAAGALAAMTVIAVREAPRRIVSVMIAGLVISTYPHMVLTWNGDAMEQQRHLLTGTILLRLGLLLALLVALDATRQWRPNRGGGGTSGSRREVLRAA